MIFKVDYKRLVCLLLPTFLRRPVLFGLIRAAVAPLELLYRRFCSARSKHIYRLTHNGQVCYLRACLNDHFKSNIGTFEIFSIKRGEWIFAVTETDEHIPITISEDNISPLENVPVVYDGTQLNVAQNNFVVSVPADAWDSHKEEIKAMVDKYKLISKCPIYITQSA